MATTNDKKWFITDRAIENATQDKFGHDDVAGQLMAIVETVTPPATVGLLGGFGTGKSSIGNLLAAKLKGHAKFQVVTLSAEKHSDTARQRALVYSFAEALRDDAGVDDKKIQAVLGRVEQAEDTEGPELGTLPIIEHFKENRGSILKAVGLAALAFFSFWAAGAVFTQIWRGDENPLTYPLSTAYGLVPLMMSVIALVAGLFTDWAKAAMTPRKLTRKRPRAEAADELERIFADLAMLVDKSLVIVVDDIDRLAPTEVLEALATIKTLQAVPRKRPPLFIISCDHSVVLKALEGAKLGLSEVDGDLRQSAEEYLNKLFVVRQPLPPHLSEDMQSYAAALLAAPETNHAGPDSLGDSLRNVLEILVHEGVNDPRHVIRLLNGFFADYRLAKVREGAGGRLGAGEVSGKPLTLARLAVLRVDFGDCYEEVRDEFELLNALDLHALGDDLDESQTRLLDLVKVSPALADFLRRTARFVEHDVPLAPFFFLGQTDAGKVLGSQVAENIRKALENNDVDAVRERLTDEASIAQAAVTHIIGVLGRAQPGLRLSNAVATTAAVLGDVPTPEDRARLANEVALRIEREPDAVPRPAELADVIRHADDVYGHSLMTRLVDFEEDAELARPRAVAVLHLAAERPTEAVLVSGLDSHFKNFTDLYSWVDVPAWLELAQGIEAGIRTQLLGPSFYAAVISASVGVPDDGISQAESDSFLALLGEASEAVKSDAAVIAAIRGSGAATGREPRWFALEALGSVTPADTEVDALMAMAADIVSNPEVTPHIASVSDAMDLVSDWSSGSPDVVASIAATTADAVAAAIAAGTAHEDADVVTASARAAAAFGALHPANVRLASDAVSAALDKYRGDEGETGQAIVDALVALIPKVDDDARTVIGTSLFSPLLTAENKDDLATRRAIESVAPVAATGDTGVALLSLHVPTWRRRFDDVAPASVDALRPPLLALQAAANGSAFPEAEEAALLARLVAVLPQGGVMLEVAAVGLATIPWRPANRTPASQAMGGIFDQLTPVLRAEVLGRVGAWAPQPGELDPTFASAASAHLLSGDDLINPPSSIKALWAGLAASDRARLVAAHVGDPAVRDKVPSLTEDELVETLTNATGEALSEVVSAASGMPEELRAAAATRFVVGAFDDATATWADAEVQQVVGTLLPASAAEACVDLTTPRLQEGAGQAGKAAVVLAAIRASHPSAMSTATDEALASAVDVLLPSADVDLATRLGTATRGLPKKRSDEVTKEMWKQKDNQQVRAAVAAFENARAAH